MSLKPRQRRALEEDAKKDPNGPAAQILKVIRQEEEKGIDFLRQASEQAKKNLNRQKILIGIAMLAEAEKNPGFKTGLQKVLTKNLTATRDREFMAKFGWELEDENIENDSAPASASAE